MKKSNYEVLADMEDWKMFSTTCQCNSENHIVRVCVSKEQGLTDPVIELFFKVYWLDKTDWDFERNKIKQFLSPIYRLFNRIKYASKILFSGYIELEESFLFREKQHIEDFNNAIQDAINEINKKLDKE